MEAAVESRLTPLEWVWEEWDRLVSLCPQALADRAFLVKDHGFPIRAARMVVEGATASPVEAVIVEMGDGTICHWRPRAGVVTSQTAVAVYRAMLDATPQPKGGLRVAFVR